MKPKRSSLALKGGEKARSKDDVNVPLRKKKKGGRHRKKGSGSSQDLVY